MNGVYKVEAMDVDKSNSTSNVQGLKDKSQRNSTEPSSTSDTRVTSKRRNAVVRGVKSSKKGRYPDSAVRKEDRPLKVGSKIYYWENEILGNGGTATVYKGYFEDPKVPAAIKVLTQKNFKYYANEVETLRHILNRDESHTSHVVRYYATEEDVKGTIFYLAIEMCDTNLEAYFKSMSTSTLPQTDLVRYCRQICLGVRVLHCTKRNFPIVHRDLKPSNVLLKRTENGDFVPKLTDFGISKILENLETTTTGAEGTQEWMSPNCLKALMEAEKFNIKDQVVKVSLTDDIFSLGILLFYIVTQGGHHPFGSVRIMRAPNIVNGTVDYGPLSTPNGFLALNLIHSMLQPESSKRPKISAVLYHPLFWTGMDCMILINNVCNALATRNAGLANDLQRHFWAICQCPNGWTEHLSPTVRVFIATQQQVKHNCKQYSGKSVRSLVEFIRDKWQHRSEWGEDIKKEDCFGRNEDTYINYFLSRFPLLLLVVYLSIQNMDPVILNPFFTKLDFDDFHFDLSPKQVNIRGNFQCELCEMESKAGLGDEP